MQDFTLPQELTALIHSIRDAGGRALLVGGMVRDQLLGQNLKQDYDIEVFGLDIQELQTILNQAGKVINVGDSITRTVYIFSSIDTSTEENIPKLYILFRSLAKISVSRGKLRGCFISLSIILFFVNSFPSIRIESMILLSEHIENENNNMSGILIYVYNIKG